MTHSIVCQDQGHALLLVQNAVLSERIAELQRLLDAERARHTTSRQYGTTVPHCPPPPPLRRIQ